MNHDNLFQALARSQSAPPSDLAGALAALPAVGSLPSPWEVWTLIGLVRHRRRQQWVGRVVTDLLGGHLRRIARMGALGHPSDRPQRGPVPGDPEWEYYFHGKGCCLTHKVTGESIDVDFFDDSAEYFDVWFYRTYLESLRTPEPPEQRLIELHPAACTVRIATMDLLAGGFLSPLAGRDTQPFRIADDFLAHEEAIDAFAEAWADPPRRLWLAGLIGDWPAAHEAAISTWVATVVALTAERAEQCRQRRRDRLMQAVRDESLAQDAVLALADLGPEAVDPVLDTVLSTPGSKLTFPTLTILEKRDDPAWCPKVYDQFKTLSQDGTYLSAYHWLRYLRFLIRHGFRKEEMLAMLPQATGMAEAGLLALEHAPHLALPLFRAALRSTVPANRATAAATLALIDRSWCHRELLAVLADSQDQELTADSRAALLECRDVELHQAVRRWEEQNPHEPEAPSYLEIGGEKLGPFYSMAEHSLRWRQQSVRFEMEQLHDRVLPLRDRVPCGVGP
jgi:hypothetical protein